MVAAVVLDEEVPVAGLRECDLGQAALISFASMIQIMRGIDG